MLLLFSEMWKVYVRCGVDRCVGGETGVKQKGVQDEQLGGDKRMKQREVKTTGIQRKQVYGKLEWVRQVCRWQVYVTDVW